jgi:hypothetical protein
VRSLRSHLPGTACARECQAAAGREPAMAVVRPPGAWLGGPAKTHTLAIQLGTLTIQKVHGTSKQLFYKMVSWMHAPLWKPSARASIW